MSELDAVGIVGGVVHPATCFGDPHYDALVAELPDSCFGDESYDALVAQLPSAFFTRARTILKTKATCRVAHRCSASLAPS